MYSALTPSLADVRPRSDARAASAARTRLIYVDTLRVILIALVVMVHAAVTYGSVGSWFYQESASDEMTPILLSLFSTLCQSFFMGLFFFISGYFIPGSFDRKGQAGFWKDRLLRLGAPFVVFSLFLAKIPMYVNQMAHHATSLSFWEWSARNFWQEIDAGPLWFVFALLVFSAAYSLWRLATRNARFDLARRAPAALSQRMVIGFAGLLAATMLAVTQVAPIGKFIPAFGFIYLQPAFFPQYILMFAAGILAARRDWLTRIPGQWLKRWRWVALAVTLALPVLFVLGGALEGNFDIFATGLTWQCIATNVWLGLACVSFSLTLTLWLREHHNQPGRWQAGLGAGAYAVYIIHAPVLVLITYALGGANLPTLLKFILASALTLAACYGLAWVLRKLPGAKAIL